MHLHDYIIRTISIIIHTLNMNKASLLVLVACVRRERRVPTRVLLL